MVYKYSSSDYRVVFDIISMKSSTRNAPFWPWWPWRENDIETEVTNVPKEHYLSTFSFFGINLNICWHSNRDLKLASFSKPFPLPDRSIKIQFWAEKILTPDLRVRQSRKRNVNALLCELCHKRKGGLKRLNTLKIKLFWALFQISLRD